MGSGRPELDRGAARLVAAALGLGLIVGATPKSRPRPSHFEGHLSAGQRFERTFAESLHFVLRPQGDEGWAIVVTGSDSAADFAGIVTPPFHGPNPTQIEAWHFDPRDSSGASPGKARGFSFVSSRRDYQTAAAMLERMLWPNGRSDAAVDSAQAVFDALPVGSGVLKITNVELRDLEPGAPARFESMSFEVDLAPPRR